MEKSHVDTRASRRRFKTLRRRLTSMMMLLVILVPFMQAAVSPAQTASAVVGLEPEYSNSTSEGTKPSYAWANAGDTTVLNHAGGLSTNSSLESHWNTNTDQMGSDPEDTYIKYGNDAGDPDYQIRKYATETETPGLYNVKLDVRGNTQNNIKPVDIVLVVDMSGSMTPDNNRYGIDRAQAVKTGVDNFLDYITEQGLGDYVRVGLVGFSSPAERDRQNHYRQYYACGDAGFITVDPDRLSTPGHISTINTTLDIPFGGGTYTQLGLIQGQKMLEQDHSDNRKMMILLTDDEPTYSQKVSTSEYVGNDLFALTFGDGTDGSGSSSWVNSYYDDTDNGTEQYQMYNRWTGRVEERTEKLPGNLIESTWPATIGQAKLAQEKGDEIHTLGIQIDDDKKGTIKHNLSLIASPGFYQYAAAADAIETYLKNQAKDVVNSLNTVVDGHINDPLGSQFIYADTPVEVSSVGANAVTDKPTATIKGGVLSVNGLNVGKNQEVEITYQVHLKTEDYTEDLKFTPDYWYQMNGKTTFQPRGDDPNTVVEFGVPSAKAPAVVIHVKKDWTALPGTALPDTLNVSLLRRSSHGTSVDIPLTLTSAYDWQTTVSMPAYDNFGKPFEYTLHNENADNFTQLDTFIGKSSGTGTKDDPLTLTNQQYGFQFVKRDADSGAEVKSSSMKFSLTPYNDSYTQKIGDTITDLNEATPHALAPGYYGIRETNAPDGYVLDDTEYYFQLTSDGKWNYFGTNDPNSTGTSISNQQKLNTIDGKTDAFDVTEVHQNILQLTKYDKPKPTVPLTVVKTDNQGTPLADAQFTLTTLTDDNAKKDLESLTSDDSEKGKTFEHQLQANGNYTLKEAQAPFGYQKSNDSVSIKINDEGTVDSVTINGEELEAGKTLSGYKLAATNDGPGLTLIVENQPLPILPHTGGQGVVRAAAFALMMLVVAAVLAVVVWIKRRGVRIHD